MLISVIIVSYNSGTLLLECVQSVLCSSLSVEIFVSDNGSVDGSIEALDALAKLDPRLAVIRNGRNLGFGRGNNVALPRTTGDYVLFLNPDCIVGADALAGMVDAMAAHPQAGMAGCLIRNPDGTEQTGGRRRIPTPRRALARAFPFGRESRDAESFSADPNPVPTVPTPVEAISGAFMLVRSEVLKQVGSFDEAYFMHWEDLDLCLRLRTAGREILFVPGVEILHFKGRSSNQRPYFVEWHKHVGLMRFFRKFYFRAYPLPVYSVVAFAIFLHYLFSIVRMRARPSVPLDFTSPRQFYCHCPQEVWVFGASSLIGRFLLPRLVAAGYCVRAFSRDPGAARAIDSMQLVWHAFDFGDKDGLPPIGRPDVVIHLAPLRLLPGQIEALAARGMKRLIGFGSTSRFTKRNSRHPKERALVADLDAAERDIETQCGRLGVEWAVFRPTMIYSFGHDRNVSVLAGFIRRFRFFPMPGMGCGLRQPVHADDLARACLSLIRSERGWCQGYNLSGGQILSYRAMVAAIYRKLGMRAWIVPFPRAWWHLLLLLARLLPAYRDINMDMIDRVNADMSFDHDDAARNFDYAPRGFEP